MPGQTGLVTQEGKKAVWEAGKFLKDAEPISELKLSKTLCKAAQAHADDTEENNLIGHDGSDGTKFSVRIKKYAEKARTLGENITYKNPINGTDFVLDLLIDDGVKSRGHRKNMFNKAFKYVGIGIARHPRYTKCCVIDYAGSTGLDDEEDVIEFSPPTNPEVISNASKIESKPTTANKEQEEKDQKEEVKKAEESEKVEAEVDNAFAPIMDDIAKMMGGKDGEKNGNQSHEASQSQPKTVVEQASKTTANVEVKEEEKQSSNITINKDDQKPSSLASDKIKKEDQDPPSNVSTNRNMKEDEEKMVD